MIRTILFLMAVLLPSMVLAQNGPDAPASAAASNGAGPNPVDEQTAKAYEEERQGETAFRQGKFEEALAHFVASDTLVKHPTALFNRCRCYQELDKVKEAVDCYEQFIILYPADNDVGRAKAYVAKRRSTPTHASAPASVPAAPPKGTLVFREIPKESTVKVDNLEVSPGAAYRGEASWLDAGTHSVTVLGTKGILGKGQVQIESGKLSTWTFVPIEGPSLLSTQKWVAVGLGGGALATGILTGVFAGQMSDASDKVKGGQFDFGAKSDWNSAHTRTWIAGGAAVALLGAGVTLWLLDQPAAGPAQAGIHPNPTGITITW